MPSRALPALIVSETERRELEQLVKRPSTAQQLALRAKIILRASQGDSQGQIARELADESLLAAALASTTGF